MDAKVTERLLDFQKRTQVDTDCQRLFREFETVDALLLDQMSSMTESQRSAVLDYIGLCGEIQRKLLVLALEDKGDKC